VANPDTDLLAPDDLAPWDTSVITVLADRLGGLHVRLRDGVGKSETPALREINALISEELSGVREGARVSVPSLEYLETSFRKLFDYRFSLGVGQEFFALVHGDLLADQQIPTQCIPPFSSQKQVLQWSGS
jgi:hypothetical protein